MVYLDDIIIFSRTVDEHFQRLTDVLRRLKEAGLKIKPNKCQLMRRSVQYLGYVVSENGMEVDPAKTSCVNNWPVPTDQERLRQFLGFASYYRKFIKNFAQIARSSSCSDRKRRKCGSGRLSARQPLIV